MLNVDRIHSPNDVLVSPHSMPGSFHYSPPENFRYLFADGTFERLENNFYDDSEDEEEEEREKHIELTSKADIWSCGIILYMMAYDGVQPYCSVGGGRASKLFALKSWTEVELPELRFPENIASGLRQTLKTALRKDPKERAEIKELQTLSLLRGPLAEKL